MRNAGAFATALALTACATSPATPTDQIAAHERADSASRTLTDVVAVDVGALASADGYVCRKRAPTGTRIAIEDCHSTAQASNAAEAVARDQMLDSVEELRQQQLQLEQARQRALQEFRRAGPTPQP